MAALPPSLLAPFWVQIAVLLPCPVGLVAPAALPPLKVTDDPPSAAGRPW